jgi:hypothetical protein
LTPEQLATAAEVYGQTGNFAEAGRAIGVERNTVRDALMRADLAHRRTLHARACEKGLHAARAKMARASRLIDTVLDSESRAGLGLEPKDIAALVNALSKASETLISIADREDRRKASTITRRKTAAEIEALERARGEDSRDPIEVIVRYETDTETEAALDAEQAPGEGLSEPQ